MPHPTIPRSASPVVLALLAASAFNSCADAGGTLSFEADPDLMPRLEALVAAKALPPGWTPAAPGEGAQAVITLRALSPGARLPRNAFPAGARHLAAAADLAENLYSVSAGRALEIGLENLESIVLPRRALAVDGLWPGMRGYPFSQALALSVASPKSGHGAVPRLPQGMRTWLASAAAWSAADDSRPIELAAAGDIQVGEGQWPFLAGTGTGLATLLRDGVLDLVRGPDIAVANLEAPISARGYPNPRKRYRFRMPPGSASALGRAGFDLLLFGNNHGFDFGYEAFEDSLADLEGAGMPMVGAGRDLRSASAASVIGSGGNRIAFVGYAFYPQERLGYTVEEAAASQGRPGISADEASTLAAIRGAAAAGATVVVLAHGGAEYVVEPVPAARELYARFVDAGAALVAGSHPHVLQGCEARSGALIAYSLGNFLFTGETEPPEALHGAILDFLIYRGKVRGLRIRPIIAGYYSTVPDPDREAAEARFALLCSAGKTGRGSK